jgi:YD repeat-containing protein
LGRLKSATNPESGMVAYTWDDNGNLGSRQDARGITTTLSTTQVPYDALNRVVMKSYPDGSMASAQKIPATNGTSYPFSYTYNRLDGLTHETYPSGRVVNYTYDARCRR